MNEETLTNLLEIKRMTRNTINRCILAHQIAWLKWTDSQEQTTEINFKVP